MIRGLWTASSGMMAQQLYIDTISNNLANVNTTGFKRTRVDFQDLLYQNIQRAGNLASEGTALPVGVQVGHGSRLVAAKRIFSQGDSLYTENELNVLISGDGFFQVLMPDGSIAYTRDGSFSLSSDGQIVTAAGNPLEPAITIPVESKHIEIAEDGTVSATDDTGASSTLGNITLVDFINPAGLESIGSNLYKVTDASGDPIEGTPGETGMGSLIQGYLEVSNVKVVEEMVSLIIAQRAFEINSKAIQSADEMLGTANNLKR